MYILHKLHINTYTYTAHKYTINSKDYTYAVLVVHILRFFLILYSHILSHLSSKHFGMNFGEFKRTLRNIIILNFPLSLTPLSKFPGLFFAGLLWKFFNGCLSQIDAFSC